MAHEPATFTCRNFPTLGFGDTSPTRCLRRPSNKFRRYTTSIRASTLALRARVLRDTELTALRTLSRTNSRYRKRWACNEAAANAATSSSSIRLLAHRSATLICIRCRDRQGCRTADWRLRRELLDRVPFKDYRWQSHCRGLYQANGSVISTHRPPSSRLLAWMPVIECIR